MPDEPSVASILGACHCCGTVNRFGARFCRKCGGSVAGSPVANPPESAPTTSPPHAADGLAIVCPNCQAPVSAGGNFCAKCGTDIVGFGGTRGDDARALAAVEECPGCGARVSGDSMVCTACGLTLDFVEDEDGNVVPPEVDNEEQAPGEDGSEVCASSTALAPVDGTCIACGAPLDDDATSCPSCGLSYETRGDGSNGEKSAQEVELPPLCAWCGVPTDSETQACPQCGRIVYAPPET